MKRLTAIFLAIAVICSLFAGSSVYADSALPDTQKLLHLGLISEEGNLSQEVSRGQFANMAVTFLGADYVLGTTYETTPFIDVAPESECAPALKYLYDMGYVLGAGDYRYAPDRIITCQEAATVLLRALGYTPSDTSGGYFALALRLSMIDGSKGKEENMTVADIYRMFENTLYAEVLVKNYINDSYELTRGGNFLAEFHDIYEYYGIVEATNAASLTEAAGLDYETQIRINGKLYDTTGNQWESYLGYAVTFYVHKTIEKETVLYVKPDTDNHVCEIDREDIAGMDNGTITYYDESEKERIRSYDNPYVIYNRKAASGYGKLENLLPTQGRVVLLDNDGDNSAEVIFIYSYRNAWVKSVNAKECLVYTYNTKDTLDLNNAKIYDNEGNTLTFADITPGDILTMEESKSLEEKGGITVYVSRNKVEGVVEVLKDKVYTISGSELRLSKDFYGDIAVGMNGVFYLDHYGYIAVAEKSAAADGYAYGVFYAVAPSGLFGGVKLRIFTTDAVFVEFEADKKLKINDSACQPMNEDTVAGKLSSGELIRYQCNESGEITDIQVAKAGYKDFCLLDEGSEFRYRNYVFSGNFAMDPKAVMFGIPSDASNEEEYYILTDGDFTLGQVISNSYKAYHVPETGIRLADAIVVYDMGSTNEASDDTPMMLVNDIWQMYDEESGRSKECIVGYQSGTQVSYMFGDESKVEQSLKSGGISLKRGDVILPIIDQKGRFVGCREVYDVDGKNTDASLLPYTSNQTRVDKFDTENKWVYGFITETDENYIAYTLRDGSESSYTTTDQIVRYNKNTTVVRYDPSKEDKTELSSVGSLKEGDICIMHHSVGVVRQIFVIGEEQ